MIDTSQKTIEGYLKSLSLGLVQNSNAQIYKAHRELYRIGSEAVPYIEKRLLSYSWSDIRYGSELNILSGLLNLVNDIDEGKARVLGETIIDSRCSEIVEKRVNSITSFTLNEFYLHEIEGLNIYQSKSLGEPKKIESRMRKWLSIVEKEDLIEIERVYVIPRTDEDHRGTYMPVLSSIMVEWDMTVSFYNPLSWVYLWDIEKTLYHEIGHHALGHTFGNDPEQEKEANKYAGKLLLKGHPVIRALAKLFRKKRKARNAEDNNA